MSTEAKADTHPIINKHSAEFKLDVYAHLPPGEMVAFVVHVLQADAAPVAVEEIVSTCFRFFPHSFALKNYFYWPDSALVSRRLHDAKEKGYLKGTTTEGFELKSKGKPVARRVAKALGVTLPPLPKPEPAPAPPAVTTLPVVAAEEKTSAVEAPKSEPVSEPKPVEVVAPAPVKKKAQKKTARAKTRVKKLAAKKAPAPKPKKKAAVKPIATPKKKNAGPKFETLKRQTKVVRPKPQAAKKIRVTEKKLAVAKPKSEKPAPKPGVKKVQAAQPRQLTLALTPPPAKEKVPAPAGKPEPKKEARPLEAKKVTAAVKAPAPTPVAAAISKEEKEKAAKVVRHVDRSDAYLTFKRNGRKARISEFDFRNMLFATMESPAETLKRNVDTFKRYAGVHHRNDLIGFLEFCEQQFADLLTPKAKQPIKKLRF